MGTHGQAHIIVVSYLVTDGEPTKDLALADITRVHSEYKGCMYTNELGGNINFG